MHAHCSAYWHTYMCVCGIMARMTKPIVATENCTAAANTERHVANAILSQSVVIIK